MLYSSLHQSQSVPSLSTSNVNLSVGNNNNINTQICHKWDQGRCTGGTGCRYLHLNNNHSSTHTTQTNSLSNSISIPEHTRHSSLSTSPSAIDYPEDSLDTWSENRRKNTGDPTDLFSQLSLANSIRNSLHISSYNNNHHQIGNQYQGENLPQDLSTNQQNTLSGFNAASLNPLYKTKECWDWLAGRCTRGNSCKYIHANQNNSKSAHQGHGDNLCHQFARTGVCQYGNLCKFNHQSSNFSPTSSSLSSPLFSPASAATTVSSGSSSSASSFRSQTLPASFHYPDYDDDALNRPIFLGNGVETEVCRFYAKHGRCKYGNAFAEMNRLVAIHGINSNIKTINNDRGGLDLDNPHSQSYQHSAQQQQRQQHMQHQHQNSHSHSQQTTSAHYSQERERLLEHQANVLLQHQQQLKELQLSNARYDRTSADRVERFERDHGSSLPFSSSSSSSSSSILHALSSSSSQELNSVRQRRLSRLGDADETLIQYSSSNLPNRIAQLMGNGGDREHREREREREPSELEIEQERILIAEDRERERRKERELERDRNHLEYRDPFTSSHSISANFPGPFTASTLFSFNKKRGNEPFSSPSFSFQSASSTSTSTVPIRYTANDRYEEEVFLNSSGASLAAGTTYSSLYTSHLQQKRSPSPSMDHFLSLPSSAASSMNSSPNSLNQYRQNHSSTSNSLASSTSSTSPSPLPPYAGSSCYACGSVSNHLHPQSKICQDCLHVAAGR